MRDGGSFRIPPYIWQLGRTVPSVKNPRAVDDGPGDADTLLREYQEAAADAAKLCDTLRDELAAALRGGLADEQRSGDEREGRCASRKPTEHPVDR